MTLPAEPSAALSRQTQSPHRVNAVLLGVPVSACFVWVRDEVDRRLGSGLGPLLGYHDLVALSQLPVDVPVPLHAIDQETLCRLQHLSKAAVELCEHEAIRRAVAALRVESVEHEDNRWSRALERASRFGPYTRRTVVLPRVPRNVGHVRAEAAYYGVGVRVESAGENLWLAHPAPFRPVRYSPASWLFEETVLAAAIDPM